MFIFIFSDDLLTAAVVHRSCYLYIPLCTMYVMLTNYIFKQILLKMRHCLLFFTTNCVPYRCVLPSYRIS